MNLNSLDLNLLVALDALLREANVSRAAMRISLSQPAASHALQRLRDLIGDPLLVRNGSRMELTPRALGLRAPLAQALDQVRGLFLPDAFDAASSDRQFRLMMPDLAVELLVPSLMAKITKAAPNVRIDVVPWRGPAIFPADFARTIDMVISIGNAFKGFHRQLLYTDSDALAVRRSHRAGKGLNKRDAFLDARHVAVVIRGQNEDLIDTWLRSKGIERRIALVVPGYIEALHVAARSERQFRLMMPDLAVELLMPPLMEKITKAAPNVRIDVVPWRGPAIFHAEFARTIDLVISIGDAFKGFHRQLLYTDSDALAVRRGHPLGTRLKRREAFLAARHVAVIIRGQPEDLIDTWLRTKGGAESSHLRKTARHQCCLGVEAEPQALGDSGSYGHDILERASELHSDHIRVRVAAKVRRAECALRDASRVAAR